MTFTRNLIRIILLAALTAATLTLPAAPALAASGLALTPPATITGDDCFDARYSYTVTAGPEVADWDLDISLYKPTGAVGGGDIKSSSIDAVTGESSDLLCAGTDPYGTWTITGRLTTRDASYAEIETVTTSVTFLFDPPARSTTLFGVSRHRLYAGHPVKFAVRLIRAGKPWAYAKVRIELRYGGVWSKVVSGRTGKTGRATWTLLPKGKVLADPQLAGRTFWFRAVTDDTTLTRGDVSPKRRVHFG